VEKIIMPKQGLQMTEGTIIKWLSNEGDKINADEPLFIVETDKLTITIDSPASGTLIKIVAPEGEVVPVAELIAVVGEPGEDISEVLRENHWGESQRSLTGAETRVSISPRAKTRAAELGVDYFTGVVGTAPDGMIIERDILAAKKTVPATPLAKKIADMEGVNLSNVSGSGPRGKIMRRDVEQSVAPAVEKKDILPMRGMRKIIAERMKRSLNENAKAVHRISVRMDEAARVRSMFKKPVSLNGIIALATIRALRDFPAVNAELTDEGIWRKNFVNLGVAVAVDEGLLVPVVKNADSLTLAEISAAIKNLVEKARNGKLGPEDCSGGSFTVSNLGMYGLTEFEAIINPPEAGILAVGKNEDTPLAVDGKVEIHPVVKLTLSYDHRVVDGAPAAQFLSRVKEYLENPCLML
jgi:pyruvate dehydrogenase E2 component (dihydrolipoamide acetyltransferase)